MIGLRIRRWLPALLAVVPAVAVAQPFAGVEGAGPKVDSGQRGCFVYDRWVVTTVEDSTTDSTWIRVARRRAGGRAETPICAVAPSVERKFDLGDTFAGMVGDVLMVRQSGSANGGVLVLERLAGKRVRRAVSYAMGDPRVAGGVVELLAPLETGVAACRAELFVRGLDRASCERRAREWVSCHERVRAEGRAKTSDPFARDAFTRAGDGSDCQVRLYEEARVELATLAVTRTGKLRAVVSFVATE